MIKTFTFPGFIYLRATLQSIVLIMALTACKSVQKQPAVISAQNISTQEDFMYQYSIIDALMAGVFDGDLNMAQLKKKGNFGIGTFNKVDGELLMDQGHVYRISYDGSVQEVPDSDSTSAAFVKFFKADTIIQLKGALTYEAVQEQLTKILNPNEIYALRISGNFATMNTRAERPAKPPYTTLPDHLKVNQTVFNLTNTTGICNGFLLPPYLARTNVPGFHLHYLANDKKTGGHIFTFTTSSVTVEVDMAKGFTIENNTNAEFRNVNLKPDRGAELRKIE